MSFGYSVGDFIAGANLSYRLIKALSETQGAFLEYQEAIAEVASLQQMFLTVSQMRANSTLSQATINSAQLIVMSSMELIGAFLAKTQKYRERLCGRRTGNGVSDSWQKVGWVLFDKEELKRLKDELHLKLSHIALLLATAQVHGKIPPSVAQYEVDSFDGPLPASPAHPGKLNPSVERSQFKLSEGKRGTYFSRQMQIEYAVLDAEISANAGVKGLGAMVGEDKFGEGNPHVQRRSGSNTSTQFGPDDPELEKKLLELEKIMRAQKADDEKAKKELEAREVADAWGKRIEEERKVARAKGAEDARKQIEAERKKAEEEAAEAKAHADAKAAVLKAESKALADAKTAVLKAEADAKAFVEKAEAERKFAIERAEKKAGEAIAQAEKEAKEAVKKKPIKFKDAVGRKFSFPFHLCATWAGIEELIKQAFLHVEIIGPHVMEGHYDLVGPNGEIILPQVWEIMIEPDWSITMHMWPMSEPKPKKIGPAPPQRLPPDLPRRYKLPTPSRYFSDEVTVLEEHPTLPTSKRILNWMQGDGLGIPNNSPKPELSSQLSNMNNNSGHISRNSADSELISRHSGSQSLTSTLVESESAEALNAETQESDKRPQRQHDKIGVQSEDAENARRPRHRRTRRRRPKALPETSVQEIRVSRNTSPS